MTDNTSDLFERPHGAVNFAAPTFADLRAALSAGWRDFSRAPAFGILVALLCIAAGWGLLALTLWSGHTFWLVLAVFAFPLAAPFAAVGIYEVSRALSKGARIGVGGVLYQLRGELWRQLPWLGALMIVMLLFWFFLGHMIFALFLGLKPMTNITSSFDVFLSPNGLMMLALGTAVGGAFALLTFSVCVFGVPMLLDREVDYVTAMITSISMVMQNPVVLLSWAAFIAVMLIIAMIPGFLGLLVVLPWLGHASWHLYENLWVKDHPHST